MSALESRTAALDAARNLLLEEGPQAVTLKAVAARINRTHANLLHHFGSAAGLQLALANHLATAICDEMEEATRFLPSRDLDECRLVDLVFDTFGSKGAGALAAWMVCTGIRGALDPILDAVQDVIERSLPAGVSSTAAVERRELTYSLVLMALGKSLMGDELTGTHRMDDDAVRRRGGDMLAFASARMAAS